MNFEHRQSMHDSSVWVDDLATTWGARLLDRPLQPEITIAKTAHDFAKVARLRYELYVERDQKPYAAQHDLRLFCDNIDLSSLIFSAHYGDELGASVRLTRAADAFLDPQLKLLAEAANLSTSEIDTTVINSRFVMKPTWRMRALAYPMFQEVYVTGLLAGAQRALLTTRRDLIGVFEKFGFQTMGLQIDDDIAGPLELMELRMYDVTHLRSIKSSLLDAPGLQTVFNVSHGASL